MDDIVARLREYRRLNFSLTCSPTGYEILAEAAATIESLRSENARLTEERDALVAVAEIFVRHGRALGAYGCDPGPFWINTDKGHREIPAGDFVFARDTLAKVKGGTDAR